MALCDSHINHYDRRAAIVSCWVTDVTYAGSPANPHTESAWPTRYLSNALVASPSPASLSIPLTKLNTVADKPRGTKRLNPANPPALPTRTKRRHLQPLCRNIMRPGNQPGGKEGEGFKQLDVRRSSRVTSQQHGFTASNPQHVTQTPSIMPERGRPPNSKTKHNEPSKSKQLPLRLEKQFPPRPNAPVLASVPDTPLNTDSNDGGSQYTISEQSSSPKKRNTSPVKKVADLQMASIPMSYMEITPGSHLPDDVRELINHLQASAEGIEVIPTEIKARTICASVKSHLLTNNRKKFRLR